MQFKEIVYELKGDKKKATATLANKIKAKGEIVKVFTSLFFAG